MAFGGIILRAPFDFAALRSGRAVSIPVLAERNPQGKACPELVEGSKYERPPHMRGKPYYSTVAI